MTTGAEETQILPDTSLYTSPLDRLNAAILVEEARLLGTVVQCSPRNSNCWGNVDKPSYDLMRSNYRAKPRPREFWVNINKHTGSVTVHKTKNLADIRAGDERHETIKVVEVP